jgi:hypothetical protein
VSRVQGEAAVASAGAGVGRRPLLGVLQLLARRAEYGAGHWVITARVAWGDATKKRLSLFASCGGAVVILITIGWPVQGPTIITVATWPILIAVYYRLACREEQEAEAGFRDAYRAYKARTPMFVPRLRAGRAAEPRWSER